MGLKETLAKLAAVAERHALGEPFICGGVARDLKLGGLKELHDVDITTGRPDVGLLADLFAGATGANVKTFADGHKQVFLDGVHLDFSTNFKYPNIDEMLEEAGAELTDLNREMWSRDFTVNALLLRLDLSETLDPTGRGLADIEAKVLRCPLDPKASFAASPNRLVRAWELRARLGFRFDEELEEGIRQSLDLLKKVKPRYAGAGLNAALRKDPDLLDEMIEMGILNYVPHTKLITKLLIQKRRLLDVMGPKVAMPRQGLSSEDSKWIEDILLEVIRDTYKNWHSRLKWDPKYPEPALTSAYLREVLEQSRMPDDFKFAVKSGRDSMVRSALTRLERRGLLKHTIGPGAFHGGASEARCWEPVEVPAPVDLPSLDKKAADDWSVQPFMDLVQRQVDQKINLGVAYLRAEFEVGGIEITLHAGPTSSSRAKKLNTWDAVNYDQWELRIGGVDLRFLEGQLPYELWDHHEEEYPAIRENRFGFVPSALVQKTWYALEKNGPSILEDQRLHEEIESGKKSAKTASLIPLAKQAKLPTGHPYPRPMVFRKNLDLGEGWTKMTDEFRDGRIDGVPDYIEKLRKKPSPIKDLYERRKKRKKKLKKTAAEFELQLPEDFHTNQILVRGWVYDLKTGALEDEFESTEMSPPDAFAWAMDKRERGKRVELAVLFQDTWTGDIDSPEGLVANVQKNPENFREVSEEKAEELRAGTPWLGFPSGSRFFHFHSWHGSGHRWASHDGGPFELVMVPTTRKWESLMVIRPDSSYVDHWTLGNKSAHAAKTASTENKQPFEDELGRFGTLSKKIHGVQVDVEYSGYDNDGAMMWDVVVEIPRAHLTPFLPSDLEHCARRRDGDTSTWFQMLDAADSQRIVDIVETHGSAMLEESAINEAPREKSLPTTPTKTASEDSGAEDSVDEPESHTSRLNDSYCREAKDYWRKAPAKTKAEKDAVQDFVEYVGEVSCKPPKKQASIPPTSNQHVIVSVLDQISHKYLASEKFDDLDQALAFAEANIGPHYLVAVMADLYDEPAEVKNLEDLRAKVAAGQLQKLETDPYKLGLVRHIAGAISRADLAATQTCKTVSLVFESKDGEPLQRKEATEKTKKTLWWNDGSQLYQITLAEDENG